MNYWPGVWTDLEGAYTSATDITSVWRMSQVERVNWENFVKNGDLVSPFGAVRVTSQPEPSFGLQNETLRLSVAFYYVLKTGGGPDSGALIEAQLKLLHDYLLVHGQSLSTVQLAEDSISIDSSEYNPVNSVFLSSAMPWSGGSLEAQFLVGEVVTL